MVVVNYLGSILHIRSSADICVEQLVHNTYLPK
jgi:hypothetical protein